MVNFGGGRTSEVWMPDDTALLYERLGSIDQRLRQVVEQLTVMNGRTGVLERAVDGHKHDHEVYQARRDGASDAILTKAQLRTIGALVAILGAVGAAAGRLVVFWLEHEF
jgi:hypothetical protein